LGESTLPTQPSSKPPEDRLDSWKEIAAYLNRDVTTVQRWEKREGMPVHRHLHDRAGSIYASRAELDTWVHSRSQRATQENEGSTPSLALPPPASGEKAPSPNRWGALLPIALVGALLIAAAVWLKKTEYFWRSPIADAQFHTVTDFDGVAQAAALSDDGRFTAFLSDRDGPMDVWVTQIGSGDFHNLTHGSVAELVNPSVRTLGFSPDGSLVTFWVRKQAASSGGDISIWAVPTLGGSPRIYLEGAAEFDWSRDGSRFAYHTPGPGDPLFVTDSLQKSTAPPIFVAPAGLHSHFPVWSPDNSFLYFVQGSLPDKLDIWRMAIAGNSPAGSVPERITTVNSRVSHPVFTDRRTLMYLASDANGSGPSFFSMDVERRIPHRLSSGLDQYTSLAASADGHRLVATEAITKRTLWRLPLPSPDNSPPANPSTPLQVSSPVQIPSKTGSMYSPRLGPGYLLYVSASDTGQSIWKLANGTATELWKGQEARILGGPAIASDGRNVAFSVRQRDRSLLYVMQADGANTRVVIDSLDLQGDPAWAPDGQSITTAAEVHSEVHGVPHLFRVFLDGRPPTAFVQDYSLDPSWSPDGGFVIYSGPDIGTKFAVKSITAEAAQHPLPDLTLTRGARHLAFLPQGHSLVFLQGEIKHKNLWLIDLDTGKQRPLTNLPPDFDVRDFDVSPDGREVVLERAQERSEMVLLDLPQR
jgi:Tol biopolymer transport system component